MITREEGWELDKFFYSLVLNIRVNIENMFNL
ncbi:hypothetical protein SAMN04488528_103029 [Clostridium frigidicarnis]|uniref:Uncharacterized protein n=1 Tax=Clostridium frigidicarnis TaxID=84698 RepID=A0A1I1A7K4_9CLOT|nr:hypothetical protein SAMN04488528_103029 [Clostridium frigidicarnis]